MNDIKFKLTANTKVNMFGVTLFQIEALVDIQARGVKNGDLGGWVESEEINGNARVSGDAWVSGDAQVYGNARVSGNAWVSGNAQVSGDAQVYGDARVSGDAWVSGNARVSGDAWVSGNARVSGDAWVSGKFNYTSGWFIGGDDTCKITNITDKMGIDYWKAQYVLGDFEISERDDSKETTQIEKFVVDEDGKKYKLVVVEDE